MCVQYTIVVVVLVCFEFVYTVQYTIVVVGVLVCFECVHSKKNLFLFF